MNYAELNIQTKNSRPFKLDDLIVDVWEKEHLLEVLRRKCKKEVIVLLEKLHRSSSGWEELFETQQKSLNEYFGFIVPVMDIPAKEFSPCMLLISILIHLTN